MKQQIEVRKIKKIEIDTNFNWFGPMKPVISTFEIEYFNLKVGEIISGFQDDQEWEGIVKFDVACPEGMQWYMELNPYKEKKVSIEKMEGRIEGTKSAIPIGEIQGETYVVTAMIKDGIEIDIVKKYTRLSRNQLENIKKSFDETIMD